MRLTLLPPVTVVEDPTTASAVLTYLMNRGGPIAIDTETTGLKRLRDRVLFWSMATEDRRYSLSANMLWFFLPLFDRVDVNWYLTNAKFDMHMLKNMGVELAGPKWDAVTMDALEDDTRDHGLKEQAKLRYGINWGDFKDLFLDPDYVATNVGLDKAGYTQFKAKSIGERLMFVYDERPEIVWEYASCDAFFTYKLVEDLMSSLGGIEIPTDTGIPELATQLDYYKLIELPLTPALWAMERTGFPIDLGRMTPLDQHLRNSLRAAEVKCHNAAGRKLVLTDREAVKDLLYGTTNKSFGLKPRYTDGGKSGKPQMKVDKITLEIFSEQLPLTHPAKLFIDAYREHSALKTLHNTYVKKLPDIVRENNGRLHCIINQAGARTSRMTTSDPSLQNIPIRTDDGKAIRDCFVCDAGYELIVADWPQIEFRIAAFLAGDEAMMEPMRKGWDIHAANAQTMYGADYQKIMAAKETKDRKERKLTSDEKKLLSTRERSKTSGLAVLYGQGARRLAAQLGCTVDEAKADIAKFFQKYPSVHGLIDGMHNFAHAMEFTHTMLGRIRRMYKINNEHKWSIVLEEERQALNTLVQGTGAEMMKLAILQLHYDKDWHSLGGQMLMTVHDELVAQGPKDTSKDLEELMIQKMGTPFNFGPIQIQLPVPVAPEGGRGLTWVQAK